MMCRESNQAGGTRCCFSTEIRVCVGDLNYGNHLANDAVLRLAHEARIRWLTAHGIGESDIGGGVGLIMNRAEADYLAQAFHGDMLRTDCFVEQTGGSRFCFTAEFVRTADGKTVARAVCHLLCFDYAKQKPARMPSEFAALLAQNA
ncbi:MAG: thioesterase family protein [Neisseria sp.]|nr:thioesterase family protein [Neisseria sp.]